LRIGARNVIREHVTIHRAALHGAETVIGSDNFLMAGCHVGHDCQVGNGTTIANGSLLAGRVTLADGAFVSGNVGIHQHVEIGTLSMIGGQSRVSKDVLPFVLVAGNSEVRGLNVVGMRRGNMSAEQRQNVRRAYAVLYRSGLNVTQATAALREMSPNSEIDAWLAFIEKSTRGLCHARRLRR
jgi:UDP-N-acetylglucosamine acyltransferase